MPLPLPNLDDRSYADLVEAARTLIPAIYPDWSDHNPTDPGIALIELFAWMAEMQIYRVNQIPDDVVWTFLKLLNDTRPKYDAAWLRRRSMDLEAATCETILGLRERYRAVTAADYEELALQQWPQGNEALKLRAAGKPVLIKRARSFPGRDLEADPTGAVEAPGHISLVVVPETEDLDPRRVRELIEGLWSFLNGRRLLGTRHHVVGPSYRGIAVKATVVPAPGAPADLGERIVDTLRRHFHALSGGRDGSGWPFGRSVYSSEIYALLEGVGGVDYIAELQLGRSSRAGETITLRPHQLPRLQSVALTIGGKSVEWPAAGQRVKP